MTERKMHMLLRLKLSPSPRTLSARARVFVAGCSVCLGLTGTYKKSIRSDNEEWFTPREFEIRGDLERSKNWKKSIRCYEWTLKELIEVFCSR